MGKGVGKGKGRVTGKGKGTPKNEMVATYYAPMQDCYEGHRHCHDHDYHHRHYYDDD